MVMSRGIEPRISSLRGWRLNHFDYDTIFFGATDGPRTRSLLHGKQTLYQQLSYSCILVRPQGLEPWTF